MRYLWVVLLIVGLVAANRWWQEQRGSLSASSGRSSVGQVEAGAPVRQLQRQPTDLMEMGAAMPSGGGVSSGAMLDTARGAAR